MSTTQQRTASGWDKVTQTGNTQDTMKVNSPESCLVGLVGKGIQRSRSPAMHQQEAAALGIRCVYKLIDLNELRLDVGDLARVLDSAELMGFNGLNITHPCKQ